MYIWGDKFPPIYTNFQLHLHVDGDSVITPKIAPVCSCNQFAIEHYMPQSQPIPMTYLLSSLVLSVPDPRSFDLNPLVTYYQWLVHPYTLDTAVFVYPPVKVLVPQYPVYTVRFP